MLKYNIEEIYYITNNQVYIKGWLVSDEYSSIEICINNRQNYELKKKIKRVDVRDAYKEIIGDDLVGFEETIKSKDVVETIDIILVEEGTESKTIKSYGYKELTKLKDPNSIIFNIDSIEVLSPNVIIKGWCFSKYYKNIDQTIETDKKYTIKRQSRSDVKRIYNNDNASESGFEIIVESCNSLKNIKLILDDSYNKEEIDLAKIKMNMDKKDSPIYNLIKNISIVNIKKGIHHLKKYGAKSFIKKLKEFNKRNEIDYYKWLITNSADEKELNEQRNLKFDIEPLISIIVPTYNTPEKFLREMIDSVVEQTYSNWQLCIADGSNNEKTISILKEYSKKHKNIDIKYLSENKGISGNTNEALSLAKGDYIALFDHDDILDISALYEIVKEINLNNPDFIYTDEAIFENTLENIINFHFKPDFSPDTLRCNNYITHFSVFKKDLLDKVGMFRSEYDGSQDYDMILRLTEQADVISHIAKPLYFWRSHPGSVAGSIDAKPYALIAGKKAIDDHMSRVGLKGEVELAPNNHAYYIPKYELEEEPLISILIPNKDHIDDLDRCIKSIIEKSTYKNIEIIIIENNSKDKSTFEYYDEIKQRDNIEVIYWDKEFNYSAINNYGFKHSNGKYIVLLNNDTEVITEDWLEQMLMYAQREDVGAVGAKLYFPDDTVQHAGIIVGIGGIAGHAHKGFDRDSLGYMYRLQLSQNITAVTGACVMMKSSVFEEIDGLDEERFKVALNDVDMCMKIREKRYLVVFTPQAELYHYESKSRGYEDTYEKKIRFDGEVAQFTNKWGGVYNDSYYNTNLTLCREDFTIKN